MSRNHKLSYFEYLALHMTELKRAWSRRANKEITFASYVKGAYNDYFNQLTLN